ncbi:MAG: trypsin-like peptidase domain-containing protein [Candidatus Dependentiae bacterium]|nr:trypsin-like peptidase domain-containing protein [Candidatus Dependentiae bacterium]
MIDMYNSKVWRISFFMVVIGAIGGYSIYMLHDEQQRLRKKIEYLQVRDLELSSNIALPQASSKVTERLVTKSEVWRPVQDKVKDTVVQIFAQIAEQDILQPYKTPNQSASCGSGFFINDSGDIITNAHVVNQAKAIWIQIPSLGKRIIDVDLIGMSERDIALLRVRPEGLALIKSMLGTVPHLTLADSDSVRRADEVLALGYPLGQQSLKSTTGVVSGREQGMIQISAAINPGNSGGPLVNTQGEVIGINTAKVVGADNIGYSRPINDFKILSNDLYNTKILRAPHLGICKINASESLTEFLGNPTPGGCYVGEVVKGSPLYKAGVKRGDMIYAINGHQIDIFGEMNVPWCEDKISLVDYVARLSIGQDVHLVVYRKGERKELTVAFNQTEQPPIHMIYPGYEPIDYEVVAGMVVTPLTLNHIHALMGVAPGLAQYAEAQFQGEPALIITHIFPNSQIYRTRTVLPGSTLKEVNGKQVKTLADLRAAVAKGGNEKFLTITTTDNIMRSTDHVFVALALDKVLAEEQSLSRDYRYPISSSVQHILTQREKAQQKAVQA